LQSRSISGLSSRSLLFRPATSLSTLRSTRVATTQDSVRGCRLHIAAVAIAGDWIPRAFKAQPSQIRACRITALGSSRRTPRAGRGMTDARSKQRVSAKQLHEVAPQESLPARAPVQPLAPELTGEPVELP